MQWEQNPQFTELEQIFPEQATRQVGLTAEQLNMVMHNIRYLKNNLGLADVEMGVIKTVYTEPGTPFDVVIEHREEPQGEGNNSIDFFDFTFYIAVAKIEAEAEATISEEEVAEATVTPEKLEDMTGYKFKFNFTMPRGMQGVKGIGFRNKGEWNEEQTYVSNQTYIDYVEYNGSLYCPCVEETTAGTVPTNKSEWTLMVSKGDKGDSVLTVEKTATAGLEDTYTMTFESGKQYTFVVTNGYTQDISGKEDITNKVSTIDSESEDNETLYPSVKAVVDYMDATLGEIAQKLSEV